MDAPSTQRPDAGALAAAFADKVHAAPAEIALLARQMVEARSYLEYGSGGSTRMGLAAGIERLISIETDRAFRDRLASEAEVAPHVASGRLTLVHADIGETEQWGYPLATPSDEQVGALLGWPARVGPVDLVLIDGRYRVAATAAACLAAPQAAVLIHDYAPRAYYHVVERILATVDTVGELAMFRFTGDVEAARALLAEYRRDVR